MSEPLNLISCRANVGAIITASKAWKQGEPCEFIYAPAGLHSITAGFREKDSIAICVKVDKDTPGELKASYDALRASEPEQEPYGDEEHEAHKATLRFPAGVADFKWGKIKAS